MTATPEDTGLPPTLAGRLGKAWKVDFDAAYARNGLSRSAGAEVACWIMEVPWAHPVWHSYRLLVIHLRPLAGTPDPIVYLPGATHELWLEALDPAAPRRDAIETGIARVLTPCNFCAQLIEPGDADAAERAEKAVVAVLEGVVSPDTDFREQWIALFGDNMMRGRGRFPAGLPSAKESP